MVLQVYGQVVKPQKPEEGEDRVDVQGRTAISNR